MSTDNWKSTDDERAGPAFDNGREGRLEVTFAVNFQDNDLSPERARCLKYVTLLVLERRMPCVFSKVGKRRRLRNQLAQQVEPLGRKLMAKAGHSRDIAARPVQAGNEAVLHGVRSDHEDDRYSGGGCLRRQGRAGSAGCDDHGHLIADEISSHCRQSLDLTIRPAVYHRHVLALDVAGFLEALTEPGQEDVLCGRTSVEEPDHRHRRLLRTRDERPSGRAAEKRDELAPFHVVLRKGSGPRQNSAQNTTWRHGGLGSWKGFRASALPR